MKLFEKYKIIENDDKYKVYHRNNIFCKFRLMRKYVGSQNGLLFVPAIFATKDAAEKFIKEVKIYFDKP